jgi:mono/diheme cytochrome c family protein
LRPIFFVASMVVGFAATIAASYAMAQSTHTATPGAVTAATTLDPAKTFSDTCAACHQEDGKGIPGAFPALAGDPFVLGPMANPIGVVLNGRAGMPTFKADLTDDQIAAALTHVRTSWGNKASAVTAADVNKLRTGDAPLAADKKPIQAH